VTTIDTSIYNIRRRRNKLLKIVWFTKLPIIWLWSVPDEAYSRNT